MLASLELNSLQACIKILYSLLLSKRSVWYRHNPSPRGRAGAHRGQDADNRPHAFRKAALTTASNLSMDLMKSSRSSPASAVRKSRLPIASSICAGVQSDESIERSLLVDSSNFALALEFASCRQLRNLPGYSDSPLSLRLFSL